MTVSVKITHDWDSFALDVDFNAPAGITALFGRSGSGKTSIINMIAGSVTPDHGRITLDNTVIVDTKNQHIVPVHQRGVGYLFQDDRLFPHLSVAGNLNYATRFGRAKRDDTTYHDVVEMLGIGHLLDRRSNGLSGGEKQRVAIARALLSQPRLLLMDEPLSALDAARKSEVLPYLERLRDHVNIPIIYVSHAMSEVVRLANHIVVLDNGRQVASGPTQRVLSDPNMVPHIGVRSAGAVIDVTVAAHEHDGLTRLSAAGGALYLPKMTAAVGDKVRLRVLAQDVTLALSRPSDISALNILACQIEGVHLGDGPGAIVSLRMGPDVLLARVTRRSVQHLGLTSGMPCYAVIKSVSVSPLDIG